MVACLHGKYLVSFNKNLGITKPDTRRQEFYGLIIKIFIYSFSKMFENCQMVFCAAEIKNPLITNCNH